jgi:hypothetical protein
MKKLLPLAIIIGLLISGCVSNKNRSYWIKDGEEVPSEQAQKTYQECLGPNWVKDGTTAKELEEDNRICVNTIIARGKHKTTTSIILVLGQLVTIPIAPVSIPLGIAGIAVSSSGSISIKECMESKGYKEVINQKANAEKCMKERGYEWKEGVRITQPQPTAKPKANLNSPSSNANSPELTKVPTATEKINQKVNPESIAGQDEAWRQRLKQRGLLSE